MAERFATLALVFAALVCRAVAAPVTVRLASWEGAEALNIQREAIADFEKLHPDIQVRLETVTFSDYFSKMLAECAANDQPDVGMMGFERFMPLASRGVLMPLDDLIASTPGFDLGAYYKQIVDVHRLDGKLYVLPRDIGPMGLVYYNKRLFDQAHIPYPDGSWTWDFKERPELREKDFLWVIHQLTKVGADGKVAQWGFSPGWANLFAQSLVFSSGGKFVDSDQHPTRLLFSTPEVERCYQLEANLMLKQDWVPSPTEITNALQSNATQLFAQQKLAMMEGGIWEVPNIRRMVPRDSPDAFDWDIALFPAYKDGHRAFPSGGSGYSIFAGTKHPREAWELVQYMAGPDVLKKIAAAGLAQPAIRALAQSEPWLVGPDTPTDKRFPPSRQVTDQAVQFVHFPPTSELWPSLDSDVITPRLDQIWTGEHSPHEMLAQIDREGQVELDRANRLEELPPFNWTAGFLGAGAILAAIIGVVYWPERRRKFTQRQMEASRSAYRFLLPWLIGAAVFVVGPMLFSLLTSVSSWDILTPAKARGFGNYTEAFTQDPRFWLSLKVTLIYTAFSVPLGIVGALVLALLMNTKVRGMPLFRTFFYLPSLASTVAAVLIWKRLFQPDGGLVNTIIYGSNGKGNFLGLASLLKPLSVNGAPVNWLGTEKGALPALIIMSLWSIGGGMVILLAGLQGIPDYYYEAATLDGASPWRRFRAVTLPLLTPALFFVLVTGIIGSFQVFTQAYMINAPGDSTLFYMLHLYREAFTSLRMGYAAALAWILFFVILAMTLVQFRLSKWVYTEN